MSKEPRVDSFRKLSEVAAVLLGQSPDSRTYNDQGVGWPFLQGNAEFGERYPTRRLYCTAPNRLSEQGDILLSVRAPVGATNQSDQTYAIGRGLAAIRFAVNDRNYGWHALRHAVPQLHLLAQGSTFTAVSRKEIEDLPIWFPEKFGSREAIAAIHDMVELAIEQTEAMLAKQQRIKAGLMHDLLTRGVDAQGCLRDPSISGFKPSIFGPIPEAWHVSVLESKKGASRAFIRTGPFGTAIKQSDWRETGIPVITIGCMVEGKVDEAALQFLGEEKAKDLAAYRVQEGDILFSRVADVGRAIVVGKNESGWLMSSNLMRISLDASKALPAFVHLMLAHHRTSEQTRQSVNSSGRDVANTAILSSLKFTWPTIDEQAAIVKAHMAIVRTTERIEDELGKLQRIKAGLMQDLLTGRASVTPLLPDSPQ